MLYLFKCSNCKKKENRDIPMNLYDKEKNNQICSCGAKMQRVIEWTGVAESSNMNGWCGKSTGNAI